MDDGTLNDALKAGGRLGILRPVGDQVVQLRIKIGDDTAAQLFQIDVARPHDRSGVLIFDQREQEMLQRRIFVVALIGERQRPVERLFKAARERGHSRSLHPAFPRCPRIGSNIRVFPAFPQDRSEVCTVTAE